MVSKKEFALLSVITLACIKSIHLQSKQPKKMILTIPVADMRGEPQAAPTDISPPTSATTNPGQLSQLLLGDYIEVENEQIDSNLKKWLKINAPQQKRFRPELGWHGFTGWIQADQAIAVHNYPKNNIVVKNVQAHIFNKDGINIFTLSMGTKLLGKKLKNVTIWEVMLPAGGTAFINDCDVYKFPKKIESSCDDLRKNIVATATQWLGIYYCWGGRSAQGVDCSSFMNLVFLAHGLQIPRNAHDQFAAAFALKYGSELKPGDLVFFAPEKSEKPHRMTHVLMYMGDGILIETTLSGDSKVQIISFQERIGKSHTSIQSGDITINTKTRGVIGGQYHVYFASYFSDPRILQSLRDNIFAH